MPEEEFKLPGASLDELEKIVQAYSQKDGPVSNDDVAQLAGSAKSTVSRCNGFLLSVGIVKGGNKKEATELGRRLGLALHHEQEGDASRFWKEVVVGNEFLSEQVTAVRVQKAVPKDELPGKILYNSGNSKNKYTETGSRTVTDILAKAGLLSDEDGTYIVQKAASAGDDSAGEAERPPVAEEPEQPVREDPTRTRLRQGPDYQIAVNLQVQIQEFDDTSKYEDLFRALRKHLLPDNSTES